MRPLDAVTRFLQAQDIRETTVTAALSGGADSVCLLRCLLDCAQRCSLTVQALHVQHGLRGAESERDEQFCRSLCREWDVPLTVIPVNVHARMAQGMGLEEAARACRYEAFAQAEGFIATAHTASDNAETLLFRLTRGTGLRGLGGIPPRRERILRPLLAVSREEVEDFLTERCLSWVTDSSNLSEDFSRNFLRHQVVPLLKQQNPAFDRTAAETAEILRTEEDFLAQAAEAAFREALQPDGSLRGIGALHPALQRRCIRMFLRAQEMPCGLAQVTAVQQLLQTGGRTTLDRSGTWICVSKGVLFPERPGFAGAIPLAIGNFCIDSCTSVEVSVVLRTDAEIFSSVHKKFTDSVLDYDIIRGCAEFHGRRPGLRIRPAGRDHHVSVKKWLNEKVPPALRRHILFLSDAEGLLWAEGLGAADRAAVTETTQRMLWVRIHRTHTE